MKLKDFNISGHKAAFSAAFAMISVSFLSGTGASVSTATLPSLRDEKVVFDSLRFSYHFREAQTPLDIETFLNDFPSSTYIADASLMLADWYFYNAEYPLALNWYSRIDDNAFSGNIREGMLYRKAYSQIKTGFYSEAAVYFRALLNSAEYGEDARFYSAYLDYVEGKYDKAYDEFAAIRKSSKKAAEADYYLNQIDYLRGEYAKVAHASDRLLVTEVPSEMKAETMRVSGLSFFKIGDKTSARNILERYIDLTGNGAEISALYALGSIYYDNGDYEKALPLFSVVTEYPGDLAQSAWLYIGQIYLKKGDSQAAAMAFDKAAKESWNSDVAETAAYNLAVTSAAGMALPFADASKAMEDFIDAYPSSPYASTLSTYLANAYYGKRDYENALRQVDKISHPDAETRIMRQKILYQLGVSLMQQGETGRAIQSLSEASSPSAPDKEVAAQASLWLGDAYYAKKEYTAAAKAYEAALASHSLDSNTALAQYNLGYAYMKLHNYAKAEKAFREASTSSSLTPRQLADARLRYGDCLYYNGKYSEALAVFRGMKLEGGQDAVFASIREADILGRDGRVNEKISLLEGLLSRDDAGIWRPTVLSRLADAYSEKGDDRKAAQLYSEMLDSFEGSDNSQVYFSLAANAENLYNAGDMPAAYSAYKRLENSGIASLYPAATLGVARTSTNNSEVAEYAAIAAGQSALSPEEMDEALYLGAVAGLALGGQQRKDAIASLNSLARSADRIWGARAAVALGQDMLDQGNTDGAEEVLLYLIDNGSDDNYWLARGYIALADVYIAQDKDYLARLYLENLRSNYPGKEKDINDMINSRLKSLGK